MADGSANHSPTHSVIHTICLPIAKERYQDIVGDAKRFRTWLSECFHHAPELFPEIFAKGFSMVDSRTSKKRQLVLRRIQLRDGSRFTIRPSFVMPYMTAECDDVEHALFLRKFGVPFWALSQVFGRNPMYWFRLECQLGRNSLVGTTIRQADLPEHVLADEHHQKRDGDKVYLATTVGGGCLLGMALAESAGTEDLTAAYGVFHQEACNVKPGYTPQTVNTDGWKSTQAAWLALFPAVVVLRCFLHAWLKIRDRAKNLGDTFYELSRKVWEAYHAPSKRSMSQRLRQLSSWAKQHVQGTIYEAVRDLCRKKGLWHKTYDHPGGHRTSNMLDRLMRPMYRYFFAGQHLHGTTATNERHIRGWALLSNYAPWHPATTKVHDGWRSPAERLNQHRYHDSWLQNLMISASMGGYRYKPPQKK